MTPKLGKQFLIVLSVSPCTPDRLRTFVPAIKSLLERLSTGAIEQLFRSMSADHFGYLIRSQFVAHQILAAIETAQKDSVIFDVHIVPPFLTNMTASLSWNWEQMWPPNVGSHDNKLGSNVTDAG